MLQLAFFVFAYTVMKHRLALVRVFQLACATIGAIALQKGLTHLRVWIHVHVGIWAVLVVANPTQEMVAYRHRLLAVRSVMREGTCGIVAVSLQELPTNGNLRRVMNEPTLGSVFAFA